LFARRNSTFPLEGEGGATTVANESHCPCLIWLTTGMAQGKPIAHIIPKALAALIAEDIMFAWLKSRTDLQNRAARLHDSIVEDARAPHLYATLKVPDTTDGRFEMLALHIVLVLDRLARAGDDGRAVAQALAETFVVAMDDTMRAIGIGDLAVPKKVKKAAAALYDRQRSYGPALAASHGALDAEAAWHDALAETLAALTGAPDIDLRALAHYADARVHSLSALADSPLLSGQLTA
jgi:hypothetical protein